MYVILSLDESTPEKFEEHIEQGETSLNPLEINMGNVEGNQEKIKENENPIDLTLTNSTHESETEDLRDLFNSDEDPSRGSKEKKKQRKKNKEGQPINIEEKHK
jgi:hypothetical protein